MVSHLDGKAKLTLVLNVQRADLGGLCWGVGEVKEEEADKMVNKDGWSVF